MSTNTQKQNVAAIAYQFDTSIRVHKTKVVVKNERSMLDTEAVIAALRKIEIDLPVEFN